MSLTFQVYTSRVLTAAMAGVVEKKVLGESCEGWNVPNDIHQVQCLWKLLGVKARKFSYLVSDPVFLV